MRYGWVFPEILKVSSLKANSWKASKVKLLTKKEIQKLNKEILATYVNP